jgi:ABC-2 type transport system permease protein
MTLNAILAISYRDLMKFLRDPARLVSTFIFPLLFIGIFGVTMQANLGAGAGYNFLPFILTGVLAQTLFMSSAQGVISLLEDRENDFSQEIFVSPISRYAIVFGKIAGESMVALPQGLVIVVFGLIVGVPISVPQAVGLAVVAILVCLLGGAFGVILLSNFGSQRAANQVVPFIMIPQFFLAGVFAPIRVLPWYLEILSRISPMRYAVDLARGVFYLGRPEFAKVVLEAPLANIATMAVMFGVFLFVGTLLFVRAERNR